MEPYKMNSLNGWILLICGLLGFALHYMNTGDMAKTALIAPAFGVIFLLMTPGMKKHNKVIAHIVVLLTILIGFMLAQVVFKRWDGMGIRAYLYIVMVVSCLFSTVVYIKSFIDARRKSA